MNRPAAAALVAIAVGLGGSAIGIPSSRAENAAINTACVVRGRAPAKSGAKIFDARTGGSPLASFTGAPLSLRITGFGERPGAGRVHVSTAGSGAPYVRIEGWADLDAFRFFAGRDLSVRGQHLWITKGQELSLERVQGDRITVTKPMLGSSQTLTATVPCDALTLELVAPDGEEPERARTYQTRGPAIDLYDRPGGDVVYALRMDAEARKVFWGTEMRGGFVHVLARSDVTIDAWARSSDLVALGRHAEVYDPSYVSPRPWPPKKLALEEPPKPLEAPAELPVFAKPAGGTPIGAIEKGARFYPMAVSGRWTSVLPIDLGVLPPDDGGFWVQTAGLRAP